MSIELNPIVREDVETVWKMQVEAFSDLLEKYQDYDMSPASESIDKVLARYEQPWTTYFFIMVNDEKVGVIRIVDSILQEKGNLHLYEKLGYHQTGRVDKVNDHMDIVYYEKD